MSSKPNTSEDVSSDPNAADYLEEIHAGIFRHPQPDLLGISILLTNFIRHPVTRLALPNLERSVRCCIEGDLRAGSPSPIGAEHPDFVTYLKLAGVKPKQRLRPSDLLQQARMLWSALRRTVSYILHQLTTIGQRDPN